MILISKERGYYATMRIGRAKRKPSIQRVSRSKLDAIDYAMRDGGYNEYDLGVIWYEPMQDWLLYACVMFDQG